MFEKIVTFVKANQAAIIQKSVITVGAIAGLGIALLVAKNVNNKNAEVAEPEAPTSDEETDDSSIE